MLCPFSVHRDIELSAVVIAFSHTGNILIVRPSKSVGWSLPCANIEFGSQISDEIKKEFSKKLGASVTSVRPWFFQERMFEPGFSKRHAFFIVYRCECASEPKVVSTGLDAEWQSIAEARRQGGACKSFDAILAAAQKLGAPKGTIAAQTKKKSSSSRRPSKR